MKYAMYTIHIVILSKLLTTPIKLIRAQVRICLAIVRLGQTSEAPMQFQIFKMCCGHNSRAPIIQKILFQSKFCGHYSRAAPI